MQLVAYGAQDIYLTGNPQITFFKVVYRRHTNFSMEAIEQTMSGTVAFGNRVSSTISRNGDLISKMYVEFNPSVLLTAIGAGNALGPNIGNTLLSEIELEIGGQRIDKHYSHWLTVWNELTTPNPTGSKGTVANTTGDEPVHSNAGVLAPTLNDKMSYNHLGDAAGATGTSGGPVLATVPLQFWFCRNPGLALPLIALQYHEVKVTLNICARAAVVPGTGGAVSFAGFRLMVDYIYLDTDERRRFAQQSHEYLIEQLQFQQTTLANAELNFNHPVKELIWIGTPAANGGLTTGPGTPVALNVAATDTVQLKLNGHDRFSARQAFYFTRTQVHQHHSGFGGTSIADSIGVYSFALKPEEHQPSGTCNFSRIDNARLELARAGDLNVYAVNYNVLRIMSGMGGLAYSN